MKQIIAIISAALGLGAAWAQPQMPIHYGNSLGLPLIPQVAPSSVASTPSAAAPAVGTRKSKPVAVPKAETEKASLSGGVTMASYYEAQGLIRVRVTTSTLYPDPALRKLALAGAQHVQRDVALSCGKLCKMVKGPAPEVLSTGQIQFDMFLEGLDRKVSAADMVQLVKSLPLAASTAAEKAAYLPVLAANVPVAVPAAVPTPAAPPVPPAVAERAPMVIQFGAATASASNRATQTSGTSSLTITP